jgi:NAD/NADP transhydrogenase alpha subunit
MSQNTVHLWLRHEVKPNEHRAALSPQVAQQLLENGKLSSIKVNSYINESFI